MRGVRSSVSRSERWVEHLEHQFSLDSLCSAEAAPGTLGKGDAGYRRPDMRRSPQLTPPARLLAQISRVQSRRKPASSSNMHHVEAEHEDGDRSLRDQGQRELAIREAALNRPR
jgi:hypothetical protein